MENIEPGIVNKEAIGDQISEWWVEEVIKKMPFDWWRISKDGNKIVIEPVKISPVN